MREYTDLELELMKIIADMLSEVPPLTRINVQHRLWVLWEPFFKKDVAAKAQERIKEKENEKTKNN